jgi:hypothetical protein
MEALQQTADSTKSTTDAKEKPVIPENAVAGVLNCFGELRGDDAVCLTLLVITRALAFEPSNRTTGLRNCASLAVNENLKNAKIVEDGCAALHNLIAGVHDISAEEVNAILSLAQSVLHEHAGNVRIVGKTFGLLLAIHDSSSAARDLVLGSSITPTILSQVEKYVESKEVVERGCALLSRLSTRVESSTILSVISKIINTYSAHDAVCEQAFAAVLAMSASTNSSELVSTIENCVKARFVVV